MPICHINTIIFIHIPKTGGTSIEKLLNIYNENAYKPCVNTLHGYFPVNYKNNLDNPLNKGSRKGYNLQHLSLSEIRELIPYDIYKNYFKFTLVRNPWDRLVSEYMWAYWKIMNFNEFIDKVKYCVNNNVLLTTMNSHVRPQIDFINKDIDHIGRFENIGDEINVIKNRYKIKRDLTHEKKSKRDHYKKYYSLENAKLVEKLYSKDIEEFNYSF